MPTRSRASRSRAPRSRSRARAPRSRSRARAPRSVKKRIAKKTSRRRKTKSQRHRGGCWLSDLFKSKKPRNINYLNTSTYPNFINPSKIEERRKIQQSKSTAPNFNNPSMNGEQERLDRIITNGPPLLNYSVKYNARALKPEQEWRKYQPTDGNSAPMTQKNSGQDLNTMPPLPPKPQWMKNLNDKAAKREPRKITFRPTTINQNNNRL